MRQSSHRNADRTKRSHHQPPSLKKSKDPEMVQRLKKSQQASERGKLKGKHQNNDYGRNEQMVLLESMDLSDRNQSGFGGPDQSSSKPGKKSGFGESGRLPKGRQNRQAHS